MTRSTSRTGRRCRTASASPTRPTPWTVGAHDDEVGGERAGRLVGQDEGSRENTASDLFASDVGLDGAGASAEAAMQVIPAVTWR
ncbi:DUF5709 domain-containing protein [Streptomyces sp. NPDC001056]